MKKVLTIMVVCLMLGSCFVGCKKEGHEHPTGDHPTGDHPTSGEGKADHPK